MSPKNGDRKTETGDRSPVAERSPVAAPIESGEPKPGRTKTGNRRTETGDGRPENENRRTKVQGLMKGSYEIAAPLGAKYL
jgi:hypothetical protein